jgi:glucuronoarabinoxylan endo-1,4-beta-xylanase
MNTPKNARKFGLKTAIVAAAAAAASLLQPALHAGTCTINGGTTYQTIDGFGFSTAWYTTLTSAQGDAIFGQSGAELGMSLLRCRISFNSQFSAEANNASVAHARGAKVMGTAWTPPSAMKDNNSYIGGNLLTSQYGAYATYLNGAANTIGLDYVSFQNEPDITVTYESCHWTPTEMLNFVKNNASAIGKPVIMPESYHFDDAYSDPTLNDSTAASKIAIVGGHIYGGGLATHQNAINKGKKVWQTEHYWTGTSIGTCMSIAKEISDCMNNRMNAYFWWWMKEGDGATFMSGSTPLKNGYTMGQFARWVRPGKVRIAATYNPTSNVYVTAYRNGGLVIVAVNTGTSSLSQTFRISNVAGVTTLYANRTSSSENMAGVKSVTVSNNAFTYTLPAQSVTTFHQY